MRSVNKCTPPLIMVEQLFKQTKWFGKCKKPHGLVLWKTAFSKLGSGNNNLRSAKCCPMKNT